MRADALLGSTDKVTGLAALADSADYLADVIARSGAVDVSGGGERPRSVSPVKGAARDGQPGGALTVGMAHLMDRCGRAIIARQRIPLAEDFEHAPAGYGSKVLTYLSTPRKEGKQSIFSIPNWAQADC